MKQKDLCYICLEETNQSSCVTGCKVHDKCLVESQKVRSTDKCTVCKEPWIVTPYVELESPASRSSASRSSVYCFGKLLWEIFFWILMLILFMVLVSLVAYCEQIYFTDLINVQNVTNYTR